MRIEKVRISDVCEVTGGTTPSTRVPDYWDGDITWLSPVDLPAVGTIVEVNDSQRKITAKALAETSLRMLPVGTVVYSTRASIGKIGHVVKPLVTNQGFTNMIPGPRINNRYLAYALKYFTPQIELLGNSTTFNEVSRTAIKNFELPLPSLEAQQRIADTLDTADALRRKDQELLRKYDELAQSIFYEMFGDPEHNQKGWNILKLKDLLAPKEKISYGVVQPGEDVPDGVPIIRVGDIKALSVDCSNLKKIATSIDKQHHRTRIQGDELLIACVGATLGKVAILDDAHIGFNIVRATARVKADPQSLNRNYLAFFLSSRFIQAYFTSEIRAVAQPTLNIKHIEDTPICVPPMNLQLAFESTYFGLKKCVANSEEALLKSTRFFNSYLSQSFA